MSRAKAKADRKPLSAYYTPDDLAIALVNLLPIQKDGLVWEPHAGGGAFVRALRAKDARVIISDIDPDAPAIKELNLPGGQHPNVVVDFLKAKHYPSWIVGNPPYDGFEKHIDYALECSPNVAFLLRLGVMESSKRVDCWKRWPLKKLWVLAQRPSFTDGGTDSAAYGFFLFEREFIGEPIIVPGWSWKK